MNKNSTRALEKHEPKLSERRMQVLMIVKKYPGCTSGELSRIFQARWDELPIRVAVETPHKRLPELENLGLVRRGKSKFCEDSGYTADTWYSIGDKGLA